MLYYTIMYDTMLYYNIILLDDFVLCNIYLDNIISLGIS